MVTIEADVPEGYRAVAWRVPKPGEYYVHQGAVNQWVITAISPCEFLVVEPVVKYREPTAADVLAAGGRLEAEVRDSERYEWKKGTLVAVLPADMGGRFRCRGSVNTACAVAWQFARIVDDGKQVLKSREWWVNVVGDYCFGAPTKEASDALVQPSSTLEKVHVREVIE